MRQVTYIFRDDNFLSSIKQVETLVAKTLSIAIVVVILVAILDLVIFLAQNIFSTPSSFFNKSLSEIFGLFLNILIALEILENITAYLRKHIVLVELVIVTSLIAVARKLIIFDFSKNSGVEMIGLAIAILSLSISYWLIRSRTTKLIDPD